LLKLPEFRARGNRKDAVVPKALLKHAEESGTEAYAEPVETFQKQGAVACSVFAGEIGLRLSDRQ